MALSDAERARRKRAKKQQERQAYIAELQRQEPAQTIAQPVTPKDVPDKGLVAEVGEQAKPAEQGAKAPPAIDAKAKELHCHTVLESTAKIIATSIRSGLDLPKEAPELGDDRAKQLADLWAPLMAQYLGDSMTWQLVLGAGVTVAVGESYVTELRRWAAANPHLAAKKTDAPKLQAVPSPSAAAQ